MLDQTALRQALPHALDAVDLPFLKSRSRGKVRDIFQHDDRLVLVTTDRLSAFDHILGLVPYKGQVLNQLSAFWFGKTQDIVANHLIAVPDPNVTVARMCTPLPVEVVVRGYITGVTHTALWYRYSQGERNIYGIEFPDGLGKNDPLPGPVITPTTKGQAGEHDERITGKEIVARGLMSSQRWDEVCDAAVAIFRRGQEIAQRAGLILVDTKYEFGLDAGGKLTLIDEVHTPDSSRFWLGNSYAMRHAAGEEPENFDKEFVRLYYADKGYRGDGPPFPLPAELAVHAAERYIGAYEMLTGESFVPGRAPAGQRIAANLSAWASSGAI